MNFHFSINLSSLAKGLMQLANGFEDSSYSVYGEMKAMLNSHQAMIESSYKSCFLTFRDYIEMNNFRNATESLMDMSNRDGTPIINYLLGSCLIQLGEIDLGKKKIIRALSMNPLLANYMDTVDLSRIYEIDKPFSVWSCTPYELEDTWSNKAQRAIGMEINEGISKVEICTLGGNIAFILRIEDMNRSIYGLIDSCTGKIIWKNTIKEYDAKSIVLSSLEYVVYRLDRNYYICSAANGSTLAVFTQDTFYSVFCPRKLLDDTILEKYQNSEARILDPYNDSRHIESVFFQTQKHSVIRTDGSKIHPSAHIDKYDVYNVRFEMK